MAAPLISRREYILGRILPWAGVAGTFLLSLGLALTGLGAGAGAIFPAYIGIASAAASRFFVNRIGRTASPDAPDKSVFFNFNTPESRASYMNAPWGKISPRLPEDIGKLARDMGLGSLPYLTISDNKAPDAGARAMPAMPGGGVPFREIIVSDGLLRLLTPDETRAVLAHECLHLKAEHGPAEHLHRLLSGCAAAAAGYVFGVLSPAAPALMAFLATETALTGLGFLRKRLSRSQEREADAGAYGTGLASAFADALEKMERKNPQGQDGPLYNLFSTHPPVRERIAAARAFAAAGAVSRRGSGAVQPSAWPRPR